MKKRRTKKQYKSPFIASVCVFVAIAIGLGLFAYCFKEGVPSFVMSVYSSIFGGTNAPQTEPPERRPEIEDEEASFPTFMQSISLYPSKDLDLSKGKYSLKNQMKTVVKYYDDLAMNNCVLYIDFDEDTYSYDPVKIILESFKEKDISVLIVYDVGSNKTITDYTIGYDVIRAEDFVRKYTPDAILLSNYYNKYAEGYESDDLCEMTEKRIIALSRAVKTASKKTAVGIVADGIYSNADTGVYSYQNSIEKGYFDIKSLLEKDEIDGIVVDMPYSLESSGAPFSKIAAAWSRLLADENIAFSAILHNEKIESGSDGWTSPVEIVRQVIALSKMDKFGGFVVNDYHKFIANKDNSTAQFIKYINEDLSAETVLKDLTMIEPKQRVFTTNESTIRFRGQTDPNYDVFINGQRAARSDDGDFLYIHNLKVGNNSVVMSHKGKTVTYQIKRIAQVIKSVSPEGNQELDGEMVISISAVAYQGSTVTANFNGERITLHEQSASDSDAGATDYKTYSATYKLPVATTSVQNLGNIIVHATYSGISETKVGGAVLIKAVEPPKPTSSAIRVIAKSAKAFDGSTTFDMPLPNQYNLPKYTIDYVVGEEFSAWNGSTYDTFIKGVSGKKYRIKSYSNSTGKTTVYNEIEYIEYDVLSDNYIKGISMFKEDGRIKLAIENTWNVPFNVELNNINFRLSDFKDYQVNTYLPNTVTLVFDYTVNTAEFKIPDNSIFAAYRWEEAVVDGVVRQKLHLALKKSGRFMGFDTAYTEDGVLTFEFNEYPETIEKEENAYGTNNLKGAVIALERGHLGYDSGASGILDGKIYKENEINERLLQNIKAKLEFLGAKVIVINSPSSTDSASYTQRAINAYNQGAHIFISIHHNSAGASAYGIEAYYHNPYSYPLARAIYDNLAAFKDPPNANKPLYARNNGNPNFFYKAVNTYSGLPSTLVEYGFITNEDELRYILSDEGVEGYADATVKALVKYFGDML